MKDLPCIYSTWRCETPYEPPLTLVVAPSHNYIAKPLGYSIRSDIPLTKLPLLTKPHNTHHGLNIQVNPIIYFKL